MLYVVGGIIAVCTFFVGFVFGEKYYIRKQKLLGSLLLLVDDFDNTRYPMVELNNDHDLWEIRNGDIAQFIVKRKPGQ